MRRSVSPCLIPRPIVGAFSTDIARLEVQMMYSSIRINYHGSVYNDLSTQQFLGWLDDFNPCESM